MLWAGGQEKIHEGSGRFRPKNGGGGGEREPSKMKKSP